MSEGGPEFKYQPESKVEMSEGSSSASFGAKEEGPFLTWSDNYDPFVRELQTTYDMEMLPRPQIRMTTNPKIQSASVKVGLKGLVPRINERSSGTREKIYATALKYGIRREDFK